ncbi:hypothetical protein CHS0354_002050 [Potamilus streckersoni]|uniref:Uncharacterized protein n=1 Tax=Potamilus streckersoni TaxID=2493646 RepID=A0AAE0T5K1_9BIVA|nr:hypothetical protein CHS0354_002050 [Potamilus streckersoni]
MGGKAPTAKYGLRVTNDAGFSARYGHSYRGVLTMRCGSSAALRVTTKERCVEKHRRQNMDNRTYQDALWIIVAIAVPERTMCGKAQTQSTWTEVTSNAGFPIRELHTVAVFDNALWVIGGYGGYRLARCPKSQRCVEKHRRQKMGFE